VAAPINFNMVEAREELCRLIAASSDPESPAATVAVIVANPDLVLRALGGQCGRDDGYTANYEFDSSTWRQD
jgi:hypothetical protein